MLEFKNSEHLTVEDLVRQYAEHLKSERNVSPHTLRNYLSDLAQFRRFLVEKELCLGGGKKIDARKVDIHVVRSYLAALTKDRKKSSIGRKLAALKGFFRYLVTAKKGSAVGFQLLTGKRLGGENYFATSFCSLTRIA